MLTEKAILEWIEIYKEQTNKEISFEEAKIRANKMFSLLKIITKPSEPKSNFNDCLQGKNPCKESLRLSRGSTVA